MEHRHRPYRPAAGAGWPVVLGRRIDFAVRRNNTLFDVRPARLPPGLPARFLNATCLLLVRPARLSHPGRDALPLAAAASW